ncbi:MAG: hypothetical protein WCT52_04820 [Candidatus Micrarchaeia archaeon]
MAGLNTGIRLKKEAKTSLQAYKDQSLLRRRFGDDAVRLYDRIGTGKPASELITELHMTEERLIEIIEFMNNNAMVSVSGGDEGEIGQIPAKPRGGEDEESEQEAAPDEEQAGGEPSEEQEAEPEAEGDGGEEASEDGARDEADDEQPAPAKSRAQPDTLSPLEKIIFDKYGDMGVQVYNLIDGEKTAEEILRQTGVSEAKLVEILEFMDEQGVIKLEKPAGQGDGEDKGGEGKDAKPEAVQEPRFKPILEEEPEETPFTPPKIPKKEEQKPDAKPKPPEPEISEDIILVDVPQMVKLSLVQKALMFAELSTKFPKGAKQLLDMVDGSRDFVDLSLATGLSFFDIDAIFAYFGKKGFISFRQLARDEIKKKYGEDGFAIYKRFGREGLLLYEMIGKEASLRDIILKSRFDPDRAIDILVFIHKVLGLDVPIDRNIIYRQLGLRK